MPVQKFIMDPFLGADVWRHHPDPGGSVSAHDERRDRSRQNSMRSRIDVIEDDRPPCEGVQLRRDRRRLRNEIRKVRTHKMPIACKQSLFARSFEQFGQNRAGCKDVCRSTRKPPGARYTGFSSHRGACPRSSSSQAKVAGPPLFGLPTVPGLKKRASPTLSLRGRWV